MPIKTTIHIPDWMENMLKSYGEGNSRSGSIATLLSRYKEITAEAMPTLTEGEWCCICDANNGCGTWLGIIGPDQYHGMWANVYDSEPDGLSEKWGVSCKELAEKLRQLPLAGQAAVWDVAARFWASPRLNDLGHRELLIEAGAKIAS